MWVVSRMFVVVEREREREKRSGVDVDCIRSCSPRFVLRQEEYERATIRLERVYHAQHELISDSRDRQQTTPDYSQSYVIDFQFGQ